MSRALVIHGGAWSIPDAEVEPHRRGVAAALDAGWAVLDQGGSAMQAAIAAVEEMEDDPAFDAGIGAFLNAQGQVQLDAALMDGSDLSVGAVAAISRVRRPLRLCRELLGAEHVLLVGPGAEAHAESLGLQMCAPERFVTGRERRRHEQWLQERPTSARGAFERGAGPGDTVGAVALDHHGDMATACSTGGIPGKPPGRVGDSPIPGAGFLVENAVGGCCCTGWGEGVMRVGMARTALDMLAAGQTPKRAAGGAVNALATRVDGLAGCILLGHDGKAGIAFNTDRMAYGWRGDAAAPHAAVADRGGSTLFALGDPLCKIRG